MSILFRFELEKYCIDVPKSLLNLCFEYTYSCAKVVRHDIKDIIINHNNGESHCYLCVIDRIAKIERICERNLR